MIRSCLAAVCVCGVQAGAAGAVDIVAAEFGAPTTRYAHAVLGDAVEWGSLDMLGADGRTYRVTLPETRVFEDVAPRVFDVDGDGLSEVIVVETDVVLGARLSIYDTTGLVSANEFIGRSFRWLAPVGVGAADLDNDGVVELAYVDRPHLAKTLKVFRFAEGRLEPVASLEGVTNHRIGEADIGGGIRLCDGGPEMIVASADWSRVVGVRLDGGDLVSRDLGPHRDRSSFETALDCG